MNDAPFLEGRSSKRDILRTQQGFTCPEEERSTAVHELFHWKDAEDYRKDIGEILDATEGSPYSVFQQEKAYDALISAGVNTADIWAIQRDISEYAALRALEDDWEEVYTEYRTKEALK